MTFAQHLRHSADPIWQAQRTHPFVVALGDGTLPKRKFRYYILQDTRYLEELARVFAVGAAKADDPKTAIRFAQLVEDTIVVERDLHKSYGQQWNLTAYDMQTTPLSPTNYAYCRHMRSVAQSGTLGEVTAVVLPCAWVYCEIGHHLLQKGPPKQSHPYRKWLELYGSPEFADVANWLRTLLNKCARTEGKAGRTRMEEAFLISSRYEWMFWDMAWREERWPI